MTESSTTMTATTTTRQEYHSDMGASSQATLRAAPAQQQPEAPCLPWLPVWHHRLWHPRPSLWDDDSPKVDKDDETPESDWLQPDNNDDKDEEEKPHFPLDDSLPTRRSHSSPPPSPKQRPDPQGKTWNEAVADSKKEEEEEEEELQASLPLSDDDDESDVSCHHDDESSGVMEEPVTPPPLVPTDAVTPDPEPTTHSALWFTLLTHLLHESQHYRHQVEELQQQVKQLQQQQQPRPQDMWNEEDHTIEFVAEDTNQDNEKEENDAQQDEEETEEADAWGLFEFSERPSSNSPDKMVAASSSSSSSRTKLQALEQALHSTQWQVSSFEQGLQNHEAHLETRLQTVVQDLHGQMADLQVSLYQQQELQVQQLQERGRLETAMMRQIMDERVQDYETQLQHVTKQLADLQQQQLSLLRQPLDSTTVPTTVHTSSSSSPSLSLAQTRTEEETTSLLALKPSLEETLTSSPTRPRQPQTVFRTKPTTSTPLAEWMSRTETSPTTTTTMTTTLSLPPPVLLSSPPSKQVSVPHAGRSTTATDDLLLLHNRPSFEERAERRNQLRRRRQSVESFMRAQVQHIRQRNWGDSSSSIVESMAGHQSLPTLMLQPHEQP